MPEKQATLGTKVPEKVKRELEKIAKSRKTTPSALLKRMVQREIKGSLKEVAYDCFRCGKPLFPGEKYFSNVYQVERYEYETKKPEIEILDSYPEELLCLKCARKAKKLGNLRVGK